MMNAVLLSVILIAFFAALITIHWLIKVGNESLKLYKEVLDRIIVTNSYHVEVLVKKLNEKAVIPTKYYVDDAGYDLTAVSMARFEKYLEYFTGLSILIPRGYVGLIFPRSSVSNYDLRLSNCVGVIDSGYKGEIKFRYKTEKPLIDAKIYKPGERVGQLVIVKLSDVVLKLVNDLPRTERGKGGYGHTGN